MISLNKLQLICDKYYKIKDLSLYKIDNTYNCFIEGENGIKSLDLEYSFNTAILCANWLVILYSPDENGKCCLIDTYNYSVTYVEHSQNRSNLTESICSYMDTHISKEFILDLYNTQICDYELINIEVDEGIYKSDIKIRFIDTLQTYTAICDNTFENWIIKPSQKLDSILNIDKDISVISNNFKSKIIYKGKLNNTEYNSCREVYKYNNKTAIRLEYAFDTDNNNVIIEFNGNSYKEIIRYSGEIRKTSKSTVILKPVYKDNNIIHYEMIDIAKGIKFAYPIYLNCIPDINGVRYKSELYVLFYKKGNKIIAFENNFNKHICFGNLDDLEVITNPIINNTDIKGIKRNNYRNIITFNYIIINKVEKKIYFRVYDKLHICTENFNTLVKAIKERRYTELLTKVNKIDK